MTQISIANNKTKTVGGQALAVSGAANNGSGAVRLTVTAHALETNNIVQASGIGGTVEANGQWGVTVVDANHLDLQNSNFKNAYTSGGTAAHVGWSIAPNLATPAWSSVPTGATLVFLLKQAPAGSVFRFIFEDSADSGFVTAMPLCSGAMAGGASPSCDRRWDSRYQDNPDWQLQVANDFLRLRVLFPQGIAGQVFRFSSWLEF